MEAFDDHDDMDADDHEAVMEFQILGTLTTEALTFEIGCRDDLFGALQTVSTEELLFAYLFLFVYLPHRR